MARVEQTVQPYAYPGEAHQRRHGPAGYSDYHSYRPWLEDDFSFRCVYCLKRMVWAPTDIWTIDHLISQDNAPHLECDYNNLVFACQFCNGQKGPNRVPDPVQVAYGTCLRFESDGTVTPLNDSGSRLIKVLGLNHKWQVAERHRALLVKSKAEGGAHLVQLEAGIGASLVRLWPLFDRLHVEDRGTDGDGE